MLKGVQTLIIQHMGFLILFSHIIFNNSKNSIANGEKS